MASWREKLNQAAQNTISKSKEVAGVAKLNVEIGTLNQSLKNIYTEVGKYVLEKGVLPEDETVAEWASKAADIKAEIEANTEKIKLLKNVNTCPGCGAEVPKTSKFCDKCGTAIVVKVSDPVEPDEVVVDTSYSAAGQEAENAPETESASEEVQNADTGACTECGNGEKEE